MSIIFLIVVAVYLQSKLVFGDSSVRNLLRYKKEIIKQEEELQRLTYINNKLSEEVLYLQNNPQAIEELARVELGMVKGSEIYYQVVETVE